MQYRYEMSLTRSEFLRLLPVAVNHAAWRVEGDLVVGEGNDAPARSPDEFSMKPSEPQRSPQAWRIHLVELPGRPFGPVKLPVLDVTLDLDDLGETREAAFVARFLLGFQRAGG